MLVLRRPYFAPKIASFFLENLRRIFAAAELVTITERITAVVIRMTTGFLELAVHGRADLIISGDADLLVLDTFRGIPIITPAAFGNAQAM